MKYKAYQIVNFKDPISVKYFEHSQKSLKLIDDLLDVEPVQCVTPDEVESYNYPFKENGRYKQRSMSEKACLLTHINFVKRLAAGEKFIVMEHDVYVWPDEKTLAILYLLMENINKYTLFYPGISNEFYTMKQGMAVETLKVTEEFNGLVGPLGCAELASREISDKPGIQFVWPTVFLNKKIGIGSNIKKGISREKDCLLLDAPITQHYNLSVGSTIKDKAVKWPVTRERNPNFYFTDEQWT